MLIKESKPLEGKELEELQERRIKHCNDLLKMHQEIQEFMKSDKYDGSKMIFK